MKFNSITSTIVFVWLSILSIQTLAIGSQAKDDIPDVPIPNLVDLLVRSPNHTIFLRLLQRTRLIPTLINLMEFGDGRGLTILAPTDESILRKKSEEEQKRLDAPHTIFSSSEYIEYDQEVLSRWEWAIKIADSPDIPSKQDSESLSPIWTEEGIHYDNINAILRQQLLYHMLNYTISFNVTGEESKLTSKPIMLTTLHLPSRRFLHEPTRPGPIPHPPRQPPHPGAEDKGGLLGGEGQKVRICKSGKEDEKIFIGTDSKCEGGVRVEGTLDSSDKGKILVLDGVLDLPPDLSTVLKTHPKLQHLLNLTTSSSLRSLTESAHTTFFLPIAESFEVLSTIEKAFITSDWELARQDRVKLLGEHMSGIGMGSGSIAYTDRLCEQESFSLTTIFGGQVKVGCNKEGELNVEKAKVIEEDILIENGVVHIIDQLLLPFGDLGLSVEKTLLTLNASRFVSLMHSANLQQYINANPHDVDDPDNEALPWTFTVPRDDAISTWWNDRMNNEQDEYYRSKWGFVDSIHSNAAPANGSKLVDLLKYHITPKMLKPENLTNGMLIGTELRNWRLKDARQKIVVGVDDESEPTSARQGNGDVGFGDANVIAEPVIVGPSIIYLISQILDPPSNPIQTAVSSLSLSTFVATVFSAELDKPIKRAPAVTYLVPHNDAFSALGLTMQYLLLDQEQPRKELRSMVEYHAIDRIVYMKDFSEGSERYPTLEGSPIWAGRDPNGTVEVRRGTEGRNALVLKGDLLTSTGVLHEIDQVELPPTLDLTIGKLMKGAKSDTMRDLIEKAGYGWLLNGTRPTIEQVEEFEFAMGGKFPKNHKKKNKKKQEKRHKKRHELFSDEMQSYVILCPTDSAFTRINLTRYYEDRESLKQLVQLHIIPSPADEILPGGTDDQLPLKLKDSSALSTLLDSSLGGLSGYGKVAFRKLKQQTKARRFLSRFDDTLDDLGWMVGIADTRGTDGRKYSAKILSFGRESLSTKRDEKDFVRKSHRRGDLHDGQWNSRSVGGILTIDTVLQPYVPGWFYRWGWIVATTFAVLIALSGVGYGLWVWYKRDGRIRLPEALEGEEE